MIQKLIIAFFLTASLNGQCQTIIDTLLLNRNYDFDDTSYFDDFTRFIDYRKDSLKYFCTGETHEIEGNYYTFFNQFKYLNKKADFKHIVLEGGTVFSYYANKFLEEGDSGLFKICIDLLFSSKTEMIEVFTLMKRLNEGKRPENRIIFHSVDAECFTFPSIFLLNQLYTSNDSSSRILENSAKLLLEFGKRPFWKNRKIRKLARELWVSMNENDSLWRVHLKGNYSTFKKVTTELYYTEVSGRNSPRSIRESIIKANFRQLSSMLPKEKFYVQMGANHVTMAPKYSNGNLQWNSFLSQLINENYISYSELLSFKLQYSFKEFGSKSFPLKTKLFWEKSKNPSELIYSGYILIDVPTLR